MVPEEEENQFCRCRDENKRQSVIQADPAFKDCFGKAADPDAGMPMRASPTFKDPVDGVADFLALRLGLGEYHFQQILSDPCLQGGLRCLR